jgi:ABC-type dipeptide/oligopeptide/nickel transport system ATPase component
VTAKITMSSTCACEHRGCVDIIRVGIAGPSGCGKSSLAVKLAEFLRSPARPIGLDEYFSPDKMPKEQKYGTNWETPSGVDFLRLRNDLDGLERLLRARFCGDCVELSVEKDGEDTGETGETLSALSPRSISAVLDVPEGQISAKCRSFLEKSGNADCVCSVQSSCPTPKGAKTTTLHEQRLPDYC